MTTWRTPASAARRKYSSKYLVRAPWKLTKCSPKSALFSGWSGCLPSRTAAAGPPTARQNSSAYGSTASGSGFCASSARAVATNSAVEPTLVVISQVSPSLRTQTTLRRRAQAPDPSRSRDENGYRSRVSVFHSHFHRASVAAAITLTLAVTACSTSQTRTSTSSGAANTPASTGSNAAASCPTAPVAVVVSVDQWGDIVSELGGSCTNVKTVLASSSVDPHEYEPSPADAASFTGAKLVVVNGADYDSWASKLAASSAASARVVSAAAVTETPSG